MKHKQKFAMLMSLLMVMALAGLTAVAVAGQSSSGTYHRGMHNQQMGSGGQNWGGQHGSNWNKLSNDRQGNRGNLNAEDRQKMRQINPNMGRGRMGGGGMMGPGGNQNMMMGPGENQGMMGSGSSDQ